MRNHARLRHGGTADGGCPTRVVVFNSSVLARLLWRKVAGFPDLVDIQAIWLELGDLAAAAGWYRDIEYVRLHQATSSALVH